MIPVDSEQDREADRTGAAGRDADERLGENKDADISKVFPANGSADPGTEEYAEHLAKNFSDWTVAVGGLVQTPMSWSFAALKDLPSREQITRHDCVEGWSAIGKWTGVPLGDLMRQVQPLPNASSPSSIAPM